MGKPPARALSLDLRHGHIGLRPDGLGLVPWMDPANKKLQAESHWLFLVGYMDLQIFSPGSRVLVAKVEVKSGFHMPPKKGLFKTLTI